jgi:hypothetical protein
MYNLSHMLINVVTSGHLNTESKQKMMHSINFELMGKVVPTLDAAWLTAIGYSQDAHLSKSGTPTGEFFSSTRSVLTHFIGIHENDANKQYETIARANELQYGTSEQKRTLARSRAQLVYKLVQSQVSAGRMYKGLGGTANDVEREVFLVSQYLVGYLPYTERLLLTEELRALHEKSANKEPLEEGAINSLGEALLSPTVDSDARKDGFHYLMTKYPEIYNDPAKRALLTKIKDLITTDAIQNEE